MKSANESDNRLLRSCSTSGTLMLKGIDLNDFVVHYANDLPMNVTICNSYSNGTINFKKGEQCHILKVLKNNQIIVKEKTETICSLPLNSNECFGIVYNFHGSHSEQLKGCIFSSVSEILQLSVLPLAIKCISSKSVLIKKGDTLVIQGRGINSNGDEVLKTIKFPQNILSDLSGSCVASFTTQPQKIQLPLSEIVQHFSNAFPLRVVAYSDKMKKYSESILTLENSTSLSILISSTKGGTTHELSITTPIMVQIEPKSEFSQETESKVSLTTTQKLPVCNEYANLSTWKECKKDPDDIKNELKTSKVAVEVEIEGLKREIAELREEIRNIKIQVTSLTSEKTQTEPSVKTSEPVKTPSMTSQSCSYGKEPENEVFEMLFSMGLAQYEDVFRKKRMTKEKLKIATDDTLKDELEVKSKIHRTKLLEAFRSLS